MKSTLLACVAKYYGAQYIIHRPLLHRALHYGAGVGLGDRPLAAAKARTVALEQRARTQLSSTTAPTETVEGEGHAPAETQVDEVSHAYGKESLEASIPFHALFLAYLGLSFYTSFLPVSECLKL
jgi:hypothetical protein